MARQAAPQKEKRIRRTPEDAKALILSAAEACMMAAGPAGLRLQDVAQKAGVSHPTILHHFGSREGLVQALNRNTLEQLKTGLVSNMRSADPNDDGIAQTFAVYRNGLAQRMIWLLQTPGTAPVSGAPMAEEIANALHAVRLRFAPPGAVIDIEDSRAVVQLIAIAAFGDAIMGPRTRHAMGYRTDEQEQAERERFETWFRKLIMTHLTGKA